MVVAVLAAPGSARAAAHLTRRDAIVIAEAQPQASSLRLHNPGSHWEAEYDRQAHNWIVLLEPAGAHNVLAAFTIDDRDAAVTHVNVTSTVGKPRLDSVQAFVIASRQRRIRTWLSQYKDVSHTSTLGDHRVWTVDYYAARRSDRRGAHRRLHREGLRGVDGTRRCSGSWPAGSRRPTAARPTPRMCSGRCAPSSWPA